VNRPAVSIQHSANGAALKRRSGFTLIELVVVLVVLGILGGLIVPRMGSSVARQEVIESAASFAHTARMARELAVSRRQVFAIEVDGKGYGVQMRSTTDNTFQPVKVSWLRPRKWGEQVRLERIRTPDGATVTSGTHRLEFRPDGTSSGAMLRLSSAQATCGVLVDPASGRAAYGDREDLMHADASYDLGD
jgi:type II secretion system protein H